MRKMFGTNPSPEGRGWPEGPGEGYSNGAVPLPLTRRFAAPSPFRRGILSLLSDQEQPLVEPQFRHL